MEENNVTSMRDDEWEALAEQMGHTFKNTPDREDDINAELDRQARENREKIAREQEKPDTNKETLRAAQKMNDDLHKQAKSIDNSRILSDEAKKNYKKVRLAALKVLGINIARIACSTYKVFKGIHAKIKEQDIKDIKKDLEKALDAQEKYLSKVKAKSDIRIQNFNLKQLRKGRPTYDKPFLYTSREAQKINEIEQKIKAIQKELDITTRQYDTIMGKYDRSNNTLGRLNRQIDIINRSRGIEPVRKEAVDKAPDRTDSHDKKSEKLAGEDKKDAKSRDFKDKDRTDKPERQNRAEEKKEKEPGDKSKFFECVKIRKQFFEKYEKEPVSNRYFRKDDGAEAPYEEYKAFRDANRYYYDHKDEFPMQNKKQEKNPVEDKPHKDEAKKNPAPDLRKEEKSVNTVQDHDDTDKKPEPDGKDRLKELVLECYSLDSGCDKSNMKPEWTDTYVQRLTELGYNREEVSDINDSVDNGNSSLFHAYCTLDALYGRIQEANPEVSKDEQDRMVHDVIEKSKQREQKNPDSEISDILYDIDDTTGYDLYPDKFIDDKEAVLETIHYAEPGLSDEQQERLLHEITKRWHYERGMSAAEIRKNIARMQEHHFKYEMERFKISPEEQLHLDYMNELRFGIDQGAPGMADDIVQYYETNGIDVDGTGFKYTPEAEKNEDASIESPVGRDPNELIAEAIGRANLQPQKEAPAPEREEREDEDEMVRSLA